MTLPLTPPPAPPWGGLANQAQNTTPPPPTQGVPASNDPVPDPPPDSDIIPGYLKASRIHLWGGSPHAGKTTLAVCLARSLSQGEPFLGHPALTPKEPLPYFGAIFTDRPPEGENLAMFKAAGLDIPYYSLVGDRFLESLFQQERDPNFKGPRLPIGHLLFKHCLDSLNPPRGGVVFIDVFAPTFTGHSIHDSVGVHRHMLLNQRYVQEKGITVIGACYGSKQITDTKQRYLRHEDRIIGAAPLRGCASTVVYLTTEAESGELGYQEMTWVPRGQNPRIVLQIKRDDSGLFKPFDLQEAIQDATGKAKADRALSLLEGLPENAEGLIATASFQVRGAALGFGEATVRRYLAELESQGLIIRVGRGYWRLAPKS
jgi:AAA domain